MDAKKESKYSREHEHVNIHRFELIHYRLPQQVSDRLDSLISKIRDSQAPHMHDDAPADVLLVAHGHILRAFVKRWLGYPLDFKLLLILEPGGVGVLT
jgi:broad specificity phosphatase PhoE